MLPYFSLEPILYSVAINIFRYMQNLFWLTEEILLLLQAFLVMCNSLSMLVRDGFSNNYISERFIITESCCFNAHTQNIPCICKRKTFAISDMWKLLAMLSTCQFHSSNTIFLWKIMFTEKAESGRNFRFCTIVYNS